MSKLLQRLWKDDCGALISMEFLFVATILVIGIVVGLTNLRDAINAELSELANAILALSQGYTISGTSGCSATTQGTIAIDIPGLVTESNVVNNAIPSIIEVLPCQ